MIVNGLNHLGHQTKQPKLSPTNKYKDFFQSKLQESSLLGDLYEHYQFGGGTDFVIPASRLDLSATSQRELGLLFMAVGESRTINLFETGVNTESLGFGRLVVTNQGNSNYSIQSNKFDFNYDPNGSFSRNAATFIGGAIFGRIFNTPTPAMGVQPNHFLGGPFEVIFTGTVRIPR